MTYFADQIEAYLNADPPAREISIQRLTSGEYEVTLTDLVRDPDLDTPRGIGATVVIALERALDDEDRDRALLDGMRKLAKKTLEDDHHAH